MVSRRRHFGLEEAIRLSLEVADARTLGALVHAQIDTGGEIGGRDGVDANDIVAVVVLAAHDHVL